MAREPTLTVEAALAALVDQLNAGRIAVYQNLLGRPYVVFDLPEQPVGRFTLSHPDVRGWLTCFAWDTVQSLLRERDVDRILTFLRGRAMRTNRPEVSDPAVLQLLINEPVLAVAYEFMHNHPTGSHESKMDPLWKTWSQFARERGLSRIGRKRFPGGPQVLSRQLTHFHRELTVLGISVKIRRSNGCHIWLRRLLDAPTTQSSADPSAPNTSTDPNLIVADDRSAQLARLAAMKNTQFQKYERGA